MSRQHICNIAEMLLDYSEKNRTFQAGKVMSVPAADYTDADRCHAEINLIFKRVPLMLALTCEMPKPGDYKAMEVVGSPVLITRDKAGQAHAFLNVCAHRWAPVAREGYGNCTRFTCPFHGWTYGSDGKLLGITDRIKFGDIDESAHGLKELPCEERHGMIFVCLQAGAPLGLDHYYGGMLEDYEAFGLRDYEFLGSQVLEGPNWKVILTNFFESYHFATQHPKTVAPLFNCNLNHYEGFGPHMRIGFALRSIAKLRDVPRAQWDQEEGQHFLFIRHFFPNAVSTIVHSHGTSAFGQIFPGPTPDRSRVVELYLRKARPGASGDREESLSDNIKQTNAILRDEDFATGLATQKGLGSRAHDGLLYGKNERGPQYFHEWVNWYLNDNAALPKPIL